MSIHVHAPYPVPGWEICLPSINPQTDCFRMMQQTTETQGERHAENPPGSYSHSSHLRTHLQWHSTLTKATTDQHKETLLSFFFFLKFSNVFFWPVVFGHWLCSVPSHRFITTQILTLMIVNIQSYCMLHSRPFDENSWKLTGWLWTTTKLIV